MRSSLLYGLALCLFFALPAKAEPLTYDLRYRFEVIDEDRGNDLNVIIKEVQLDDLPEMLAGQVHAVVSACINDPYGSSRVKAYSYSSENTRRRKIEPHYIIDMMPLVKATPKPCTYASICAEGTCHLWGYRSIGNKQWERSFTLPIRSWSIGHRPSPYDKKFKQTYLATQFEAPSCEELNGRNIDENFCEAYYVWGGESVSLLRDIAAPQENDE